MASKSQKNEKTWSQKLAESQGLKKQGSEFLYERVILYIEISKDKDFIADCRHRRVDPHYELSRELDDSPIKCFAHAIEMMELFPKKEDWKTLGTQKIIAKTKIHRDEQEKLHHPPVPRPPKATRDRTASELKEENERLKRVVEKANDKAKKDAAEKKESDKLQAAKDAETKRLQAHNAELQDRVKATLAERDRIKEAEKTANAIPAKSAIPAIPKITSHGQSNSQVEKKLRKQVDDLTAHLKQRDSQIVILKAHVLSLASILKERFGFKR